MYKRPRTLDDLILVEIGSLPEGRPLEHALHVKRRRTWNPSTSQSLQNAPLPLPNPIGDTPGPSSPPTDQPMVEVVVERVITPHLNVGGEAISPLPFAGSPEFPPSPAMIVECGSGSGSSTSVQRPLHYSRQPIRDSKIKHELNYGSEPDSDASAEENDVVPTVVPRSQCILMDTPKEEPAASDEPDFVDDDNVVWLLPNNLYDFEWRAFPNPPIAPESRREIFSASNVGPTTPCVDPYETFIAIWDRQFMEYIASETNKYAQLLTSQKIDSHNLHPTSRICKWRDTTADELYIYFGLLLAMGVMVKSRMEEYWTSNNDVFYSPGFSAQMSLRRFQLLSRCLHFNDNENMCALELDPSEAKLHKIQPVLSHLNSKFQLLYHMRQNIALDESLLQGKGWLDINQLIPNKAASVGIKSYEICESQTGYLWRFEVHAHKKGPFPHQQQSDPLTSPTSAIVLRLIQGLENKGHTLWMDNFYNSPALARRLKTLGFDCVGTLRTNSQFVPEALKTLTKSSMRPGQIAGFTSGDVDLMVWRDQNRVATISTYHGNAIALDNRIPKPILIMDYNIMMGEVDKKDRMLAMYPIERKRTRVCYKKLFRRLLNVSVLNSYILVKQSSSTLTHHAFRLSLVKTLLDRHNSRSIPPPTSAISHTHFEAKIHRLAENPFVPGSKQRQRRLCSKCKKRVHFYCKGCNIPVCIEPCFALIHQ